MPDPSDQKVVIKPIAHSCKMERGGVVLKPHVKVRLPMKVEMFLRENRRTLP
jgi:hypothetical protein